MADNPSKNGTAQVVEFPNTEECAPRLRVEVERLASPRISPSEREYLIELPGHAEKYGVDKAVFRRMVMAAVKEREKKERAEQVEQRRIEARAEKKQTANRRESERKQERDDRRIRQDEQRARKEAERAERERKRREAVFAEIAELPKLTHETRLKEAAARLGEDLEILMEEFEVFLAARTIPEALQPWDEPVDVAELLGAIEAKFRRYVVASDAIVTASILYAPFTYVVEVTTHAPKLIFTFPERDAGKSMAQDVLYWMVLRPYGAVEATGAAIYRIIDRLRPTLLLDEGDTLFARSNVLAHIINASWANNRRKVPRAIPSGKTVEEFDVYGAQIISMKKLRMPDTVLSRSIICLIWPKLASELVEEFTYQDDDEFKIIRRKLLRFAIDNAVALRAAKPEFPPGFNNRIRVNWKMLLALAELAGGKWPKRVRNAALELETDRDEPSEAIRLFQALQDVWGKTETWISESLCKALAGHSSGEYADFRGKGPITPHQLAAVLRPFGIRPIHNLHPTGRSDDNHGFGDFARSVLADERTKDTIRKNDDLKKEFPPAPLVTLFRVTDGAPPSLDFLSRFFVLV